MHLVKYIFIHTQKKKPWIIHADGLQLELSSDTYAYKEMVCERFCN